MYDTTEKGSCFRLKRNSELPALVSFLRNISAFNSPPKTCICTDSQSLGSFNNQAQEEAGRGGASPESSGEGREATSTALLCVRVWEQPTCPETDSAALGSQDGLPVSASSSEILFYRITLRVVYGPE